MTRSDNPTLSAALAQVSENELVRIASELIAVPSLSAAESPAQHLSARLLTEAGMDVEQWSSDVPALEAHPMFSSEFERREVLGVVGRYGRGEGRSLLLTTHVDVVPVGAEQAWTTPPFQPRVRNGRLYGRGSCDAKGGLAAAIHAVQAAVSAGVELLGEVLVSSVVGEEDGGCGTLATLLHGVRADGVVILEPTGLAVAPASAGALSFRIRLRGRAAHGAIREEGVSAIAHLDTVLVALAALEGRRNARYRDDPLFSHLRLPFSICTGRLRAGDWPSTEADWLELEGRYGVAPGEDLDEARRELEEALRSSARGDPWLSSHLPEVEWWGAQFVPGRTPVDAYPVPLLASAVSDVLGRPATVQGMPYGCDLGLTTGVGALPTVVFGPGDVRDAHRPDESVPVEELVLCARALVTAIVTGCEGRLL